MASPLMKSVEFPSSALSYLGDMRLSIPLEQQIQALGNEIALILVSVQHELGELLSHRRVNPDANRHLANMYVGEKVGH